MHYFSNLFWYRTLQVSDRFTVYHQESSTVYTGIGICHTCYADCLLARSGWSSILISLADSQHNGWSTILISLADSQLNGWSSILILLTDSQHNGWSSILIKVADSQHNGWSSILILLADSQHNVYDKYLFCVYSTRLLMIDSKPVGNM
jgi:hypothetical protein